MKTDIDIKDCVYDILKGSTLVSSVSGQLRKTIRPNESDSEDIVISVLSNQNGERQEAFVYVNVYVPDLYRDGQFEENTIRLRELCDLCSELFAIQSGAGWRMTIDTQRTMPVDGKDEHFISNKLLYQCINE